MFEIDRLLFGIFVDFDLDLVRLDNYILFVYIILFGYACLPRALIPV